MKNISFKKILGSWVLACTSAAVFAVPVPGPDAFGYSGSTIAHNFRDISATGTRVLQGTDDSATGPTIGLGFNFNFYGNTFSNLNIATNGFLSFGNADAFCCNGTLLGAGQGVSNQVAPFHMDWMTTAPGAGIFYQSQGAAGSREFIVQWNAVNEFGNGSNRATFEAILHEASNDIEFQYVAASNGNHRVTVGIQNAATDIGLGFVESAAGVTLAQNGLCFSTNGVGANGTCPVSTNVPEPATLALVGLGMLGLGVGRRRKLN